MLRLFLLTLLLLIAAVTGIVARRIYVDQAQPTGFATFYVGGRQITVERALIRNPDLRDGGVVNRLDLMLSWPDFRAAAAPQTRGREIVFVALEDAAPAQKSRDDIDPAMRPVQLYAKFLDEETREGPADLVLRQFRKGTPYEGELLYLATPDESVFSARCPTQAAIGSGVEELCLWQSRIRGFDVQTRFSPRYLAQWPTLVAGIHAAIPRIAGAER